MRKVMLIGLLGLLAVSCQKQEKNDSAIPDTQGAALFSNLPRIRTAPGPTRPDRTSNPVMPGRCVNSYEDLVTYLGGNQAVINSVILDDGTRITPQAADLGNIVYKAISGKSASSLFQSNLSVKWRESSSSPWLGFGAAVWTLGCTYSQPGGPYTNLMKGEIEIVINTSFYWSVGVNANAHIKYLMVQ